jgi:hypothetical protein
VPWLVLVFLLTAGAFGIPCMRPSICCHQENAAMDFAALLVACAAAFGCYALAAHVGEGRGPSELGCGGADRLAVILRHGRSLLLRYGWQQSNVSAGYDHGLRGFDTSHAKYGPRRARFASGAAMTTRRR